MNTLTARPRCLSALCLLACGEADTGAGDCVAPPVMVVSTRLVEFGVVELGAAASATFTVANAGTPSEPGGAVLPLAIGSHEAEYEGIDVFARGWGDFAVSWDVDAIECSGVSYARHRGDSAAPHGDTNLPPVGDTATPVSLPVAFVLEAGCSIPVTVTVSGTEPGDNWGAVRVESVNPEEPVEGALPPYARDPRNWLQQVYLHAERPGVASIEISPLAVDFGSPPADGTRTDQFVTVSNTGGADLTLAGAALDGGCSPDFSLVSSFPAGTVVAPGASVEVTGGFSPTAEAPVDCLLSVFSDDTDQPVGAVVLYAWFPATDSGSPLVDDDHDGYAEVDNDCDDTDITMHPGAVEWCDGMDNDCDGLKDSADGCGQMSSQPIVIGGVDLEPDACVGGGVVTVSAFVHDPDGQTTILQWGDDANTNGFGSPTDRETGWTCPEIDVGDCGAMVYTLYVVAIDADSNQDWTDGKVVVYEATDPTTGDPCPLPWDEVCP